MKRLFIVVFASLCLAACDTKKEAVTPTPEPVETGTFMLHLHTYIDLEEVDLYNIGYQTSEGRSVSLSMSQLYLSDIQLVKADGSLYNVAGKRLLKKFETHTYLVGEVPVGNYKAIRFKVGLDTETNAKNPKAVADSTILNTPSMWFGNAAQPDGYVFMNVQGKIDTSADLSGTPIPFSYKIGTNAHYKQVTMEGKNFAIVKGEVTFGHIIIDYSKLFSGVALNQLSNLSINTASDNQSAIAQKIANNIPSMFIYE